MAFFLAFTTKQLLKNSHSCPKQLSLVEVTNGHIVEVSGILLNSATSPTSLWSEIFLIS